GSEDHDHDRPPKPSQSVLLVHGGRSPVDRNALHGWRFVLPPDEIVVPQGIRRRELHRVKAGNILLDQDKGVKLSDSGVTASLYDSIINRHGKRKTLVGTPCWMAPEVMEQKDYDFKADIWSFGITALELAIGHAPFSSQPPAKVFLMTLQHATPSLHNTKEMKFSDSFKSMIATCLIKDPTKRPPAKKLLKHPFFRRA
ncbi:hypothetical protein ACJX0J_036170, partial [Zea mays]